jgi:hypothetical protein
MFRFIFILFLGIILSACTTTKLSHQEVAREFWTSIAADKYDKAKTYVKDDDISQLGMIDSLLIEKINLKAHQDINNACIVPTALTITERGEARTLSFGTVLEKDNGGWKINLLKTNESLLKSLDGKKHL